MSLKELYTKDAKVWVPDNELVWKAATVLEDYKTGELQVEYEDEREEKLIVKKDDNLPPLRNPEILIGENDLTSLSYLHEPAEIANKNSKFRNRFLNYLSNDTKPLYIVLYNLQVRFCDRNDIYTYCGIVLVAINPYSQLPIYDVDTIRAYSGQDMSSMDPHIFAVAEEAFKSMSRFEENQSLIVSGESGAGKTVSAKYAMRYFATVCGAEAETQIEKKVLASNPIMESFGNAKTTRNDNSSRFGKYIGIDFSKKNTIIGANMRTYLLEKSRVVFQASDERNYHIFYQLCASASEPEFEYLKLDHADVFYYTNQGESPVIDGVDDCSEMTATREAFTLLGISKAKQLEIFRIIAGVLHMGNLLFAEGDNETSSLPKTDKHLSPMTEMFGIDAEQIRNWLCQRKIVTANEVFTKPLTLAQACFARDALAKHIYSQLFQWIVEQLNKALSSTVKSNKFIGVLDIYGFETFDINSFEQFCINYANEKLQQQFCLHVFKLEQEEYMREQIAWSFIDFYDNQPCIDLIEGKLGILDLLDEECKMPSGSDKNWCQKLYTKHIKSKHFEKPRMSQTAFMIHHFADKVLYQIDGCLEKNRDTVLEEQLNILKASQFELVGELFQDNAPESPNKLGPGKLMKGGVLRAARAQPKSSSLQKQHKKTVGSQFRDSLSLLMETLFSTTPHYVRCIKPNDFKMAFTFEPKRAVQQLRACGVLETIRISAAGYPSRWTYAEFFQRYRVLAHSKQVNRKNMKKTCENILIKLIEDRDRYQFGKTKIFFRAGQVAYLEKLRSDKLRACGVMIQKRVRGWLAKMRYKKICKSVYLMQKFGRGMLARRQALFLRRTHSATIIQAYWRRHSQRQRFLRLRGSVIAIQSYARGVFGRRRYCAVRANVKATVIQKYVRSWVARRKYKRVIRGIILLQSHVRRRAAKKELKQLKIEARSVEHMKNVAKGLENKIIELQQKLDHKNKEMNLLREDQLQLNQLRNECEKLRSCENENKITLDRVAELEAIIAALKIELVKEKDDKKQAIVDKEKIQTEKDMIIQTLSEEKDDLKAVLEKRNQEIKEFQDKQQDLLKNKMDEAKAQMVREVESERVHHQKLVKDYARLQQRLENLQGDMQLLTSPTSQGHKRTPSNISNISMESESSVSTERSERVPDLNLKQELEEEDMGYGSGRRKEKNGKPLVNHVDIERKEAKLTDKAPSEKMDIALVSRLQNKVKELERERASLQRELERREDGMEVSGSVAEAEKHVYDAIKLQELEMDNGKVREELRKLRSAVANANVFEGASAKGSIAGKQFMGQFAAMEDELSRRREECIQLRTLLATRSKGMSPGSLAQESYGGDMNLVNEDGELDLAYKTQKDLNKLLENELQRVQKNAEYRERELRHQVDELKVDNDRQQKLIGQKNNKKKNLTMTPEAKIEATMQHEITRLTSENLDLREQIDKQKEQIKKLKKALKVYAKRMKATEASDVQAMLESEMDDDENMPVVKHYRGRDYSGMFEYRKEDEPLVVKNLIMDLKPRIASQQLPGLPAYIVFMCIRHTDYLNNDEKVRSLLTNTINGVKKVVKKRQDDIETITLWLGNTCRLLHNLKQYSGEKAFQTANTPKQNEHCLRNFDLSEYRQILSDCAVWIYQGLIKVMESHIHPMIVGAVLEHEPIAGLSGSKPTGMRGRVLSNSRDFENKNKDYSLDHLMKALNSFMRVLNVHAIDPELVKQIFKQLMYFICANSLNNLLLRKDMCHWSKGMQIRFNMSHLEQWLRDNRLQDTSIQNSLDPIIQASQLLQARKSEADVDSICEMCSKLTTSQIIKILNLYTPVDEFEERVPISFIRKIQERLSSRSEPSQSLLMDTKQCFAVTFPFNPSSLGLETVVAPTEWGLGFLKRL